MRFPSRWSVVSCLVLAASVVTSAHARVEVSLDAATLNSFLASVTPPVIDVPLAGGRSIALELHDLRVTGFDPTAGSRGQVVASVRVGIPALGINLPMQPRLSLDVRQEKGEKLCVLHFERMEVKLPVTGALDVAALLPAYRIPAEGAWTMSLVQGDVRVKSRLVDTRMGSDALKLGFEIDVLPPERAAVTPPRS